MKKILLLFVGAFMLFPSLIGAADLTTQQKQLRASIQSFLKEDGFTPSIDQDGDLAFKIEGKTYYISISAANTDPFYVRFSIYHSYSGSITKSTITKALVELNRYKGVKVLCYDENYVISADNFVRDAEEFKVVFYRLKRVIQALDGQVATECAKVE